MNVFLIKRPYFIIAVGTRTVVLSQNREVILFPRKNLTTSEDFLVVPTRTGGGAEGISQGCCGTSCNAQDSPRQSIIWLHVSSAAVEKAQKHKPSTSG